MLEADEVPKKEKRIRVVEWIRVLEWILNKHSIVVCLAEANFCFDLLHAQDIV